jgi:septal ring factor EnvC (AmiA/AmiB activator)
MSMADSDLTVEILKDIRNEIRGTNQRLDVTIEHLDATNQHLDATNHRLDVTIERLDVTIQRLDVANQRLDVVGHTLLDLAERQSLVVRYTEVLAATDSRIEGRVGDLEARVDKLESR